MAIKFKGDTTVAIINSIKKAEVDTVYRCFDSGVLLSNEVINHGDFVSWDGTKWIKRPDLSYVLDNSEEPIEQQIEDIICVIPEDTTEENPLVNEAHLNEARPQSPNDGFYVSRNGVWKKVYDLTVIPIEGFPVDNEDYEKIGDFNGNLYPYFKIEVTGEVEVGMFNYDTKQYDAEFELSDETHYAQLDAGGKYEIHAKGTGTVSVTVSADSFEGGENEEV